MFLKRPTTYASKTVIMQKLRAKSISDDVSGIKAEPVES